MEFSLNILNYQYVKEINHANSNALGIFPVIAYKFKLGGPTGVFNPGRRAKDEHGERACEV